jgi:hypothetical protein
MRLRGVLREKLEKKRVRSDYPKFFLKPPKHIIILQDFKKSSDVDTIYTLLEPFVHVHVKWVAAKKKTHI